MRKVCVCSARFRYNRCDIPASAEMIGWGRVDETYVRHARVCRDARTVIIGPLPSHWWLRVHVGDPVIYIRQKRLNRLPAAADQIDYWSTPVILPFRVIYTLLLTLICLCTWHPA